MNISGLLKTTLLDYPGHLAATVFTGGCNFRCPFCHNKDLLDSSPGQSISENEVIAFLRKRSSILEGVCITGGEPTLQPDLENFIKNVRQLDLLVKLDTNGYKPEVLKKLCEQGLVDYVAMDIKSGKSGYSKTAGFTDLSISKIDESIQFLISKKIPHEFRTTVVKELHAASDFEEIGHWIKGSPRYYLQNFENSEQVLTPGFSSCTAEELNTFKNLAAPYVGQVLLRGISQ